MRRAAVVLLGVVGSLVLAAGLGAGSASTAFVAGTLGACACWLAGAGLAAPLPLGRRSPGEPLLVAAAAFGLFAGTAVGVRSVPLFERALGDALDLADEGALRVVLPVALLSAFAEELYFRGALWRLAPSRPLLWTTGAYVVLTAVSAQNLAIGAASAVMGALFGWQRLRGGGLVAPVVTHLAWSTAVILLLPR